MVSYLSVNWQLALVAGRAKKKESATVWLAFTSVFWSLFVVLQLSGQESKTFAGKLFTEKAEHFKW